MISKNPLYVTRLAFAGLVAAALVVGSLRLVAADGAPDKDKEREALAVLQSSTSAPADKALACKRLAVYGGKDAVPALAPLLLNPELASWARIPLEVIPDPSASAALRDAMDKVQGRLLVGVINSIGVRHDTAAVGALVARLKDADASVAEAAAIALGRIGGETAAQALLGALEESRRSVRSAAAQGCLLCAETDQARGDAAAAVKLYDAVRHAELPKQRIIEATRGAILARGTDGLPLLLEQLRSMDKALFGVGLRVARELPGEGVTQALAAELDQTKGDRQSLLLLAVADRTDASVLPAVLKAAESGSPSLRVTAVQVLEHLGNVSCVPALLGAAVSDIPELSRTAQTVLSRLAGSDVDADLLARLPQSAGKSRQVLIQLAGQRRLAAALPTIVASVADADPDVRAAAVEAIAAVGEDKQAGDLVHLLEQSPAAGDRADLEKALLELSGRRGAGCTPYLLPLTRSSDAGLRVIGLHALASVGGAEALAAVKAALRDSDETVQDEAVRTLSTWPNNWPDDTGAAEPLLNLAKTGKKKAHQVLGFRGYLECVQADKQLNNDDKVGKISSLLPTLQWPEEKQLAIAVLGTLPSASALEVLNGFMADTATAEAACSAITGLAGRNLPGVSKEQRQKALQTVIETSKSDATKKAAEKALKAIK